MGRWLALLSLAALVIAAVAIDPCKRQTFRGRCPSVNGQPPKRSQFVLRYYLRSSGECVSYPYGHCASDESEPQLYRYKEECEVSCANNDPANLGFAKTEDNQTYGTVAPLKETPTVSSAEQKDAPAIKEAPATTSTPITTTEATTTEAPTARTEATTTTTRPSTASTTTEATTTEVPSTVAETTSSTTTTTQKSTTPITTTHAPERATVTQHESTSALEEDNSLDEDKEEVQESSSTSTAATTTTAAPTTSAPRTECERRRAAASSSKIRGGFIPVCDVNGTFQKVQCEPDGRQCFCVNNVGIEITNSRTRNGAKPDCDKIESAVTPKTQSCVGTVERGPCSSSFTHFYFDAAQQRCLSFVFSGCGGNGNNFETEADCQRQCVTSKPVEVIHKPAVSESKDVCSLPKERGPCDKYELRFYYNGETKECKYFFWGGCEGNSNNFETAEACQSACGVAKTVSQSRVPQPHQVDQIKTIPGTRVTPKGARPVVSVTEDSSADESSADITTTTPVPTTARVIPQTVPTRPSLRVAATSTAAPAQQTQQPIRNTPIVLLPGDQDTADSANRCAHPKDSGSCRGQFVRWYWDNQKKACDVFSYSGCEGNGNNFASKEECHAICHVEPVATTAAPDFSSVCKHDVDAGECNGVFQRFAFDSEAAECRPFTYGGCGGNGNNFATIAECRSKCQKVITQSVNVCEFEIEAGECTGVFPRFAYDRETNDCRPFTYGGCGGNGNNFAAIAECRNVCVKKSCQPVGQCDLTRCQVVNDNRGCPFCSCSPTKLPNPTPQCPAVDVARCQEPCIIINNRRGCQECACPKVPQTIIPPVSLVPPTPEARPPGFQHRGPQAPATPDVVAPPASSSGPAQPPAPRATTTTETAPKAPLPPSFTAELQEKCMQPLEPGPCKNFVDRWFFSQEDGTCHPFKYGGCAGNRNHFFTQRECEIHCARFLHPMAPNELTTSTSHEHADSRITTSPPLTGPLAPHIGNRVLAFDLPSFVRGQQKLETEPSVKEWPETYETITPIRLEVHREVQERRKPQKEDVPAPLPASTTAQSHIESRVEIVQPVSVQHHKVGTTPKHSIEHEFTEQRHIQVQTHNAAVQTESRQHVVHQATERVEPVRNPVDPTFEHRTPQKHLIRQEAAKTETRVTAPVEPQQPTYFMNAVKSYNPQMNPNLEALSPPVDPTYFTYNSQHLGVRRQFAVNSVPFDKNIPNPVFNQGFAPLVRRPQVVQTEAERKFEQALSTNPERIDTPVLQGKATQQPPQFVGIQNRQQQFTANGFVANQNVPRAPTLFTAQPNLATRGFQQVGQQNGASVGHVNPQQTHLTAQTFSSAPTTARTVPPQSARLPEDDASSRVTGSRLPGQFNSQQSVQGSRSFQTVQQQVVHQQGFAQGVQPQVVRQQVQSQPVRQQATFQTVHQQVVPQPTGPAERVRPPVQPVLQQPTVPQTVSNGQFGRAPSVSQAPVLPRSFGISSQPNVLPTRETTSSRTVSQTDATRIEANQRSQVLNVQRTEFERGGQIQGTQATSNPQKTTVGIQRQNVVSNDLGRQNSNFQSPQATGQRLQGFQNRQFVTETPAYSAATTRSEDRIPSRPRETTPFIEPIRQLFQPKQNAVKTVLTQGKPLPGLVIHPIENTTPMIPKRIVFREGEQNSHGPIVHGLRSTPYGQAHWIYYEGDYYGPLIPGIKINKSAPIEKVDGTIAVEEDATAREAFESFKQQAAHFQQSVASYIKGRKEEHEIRNAPIPGSTIAPPAFEVPKNGGERAQPRIQLMTTEELLGSVPFERQAIRVPTELRNSFEQRSEEIKVQRKVDDKKTETAKEIKEKQGGDAEDETDTPDYESEEQDTPRRAKTHGVSQQSFSEPLPVENYKTPNPPLRGPYGKKSDEPITTQGVKITTTTAPQTRATRISTTSTTTTTQAPVTEEASEEETDAAEEEKTTTEAAAVPTTEEVETEAEEEFEKDETEATVIVNTEAPTTTTLAPTQAPTTATSATTTVETTTVTTTEAPAVTTEATDTEEEMVEVEEEEDKKPDEAVEEQPEPTTSQPTSSASTSSTAASTTAQTTTAAPTTTDDVYTTLINEIDSMEEEEGVEENEVAPTTMMASSKFAVHRETEEVIKFEEVENTSAAKAEKVDSVKAITLKKVEITRPPSTVAPSTTQQSTTTAAPTTVTQTPSTEPSTEATTTVVETTATSTTTVASTTALPGTPAAVTTTTGTTTGAPVTTTQTILISTTESTTAVPSTTASPSTAAPTTTRFVTSSTLNTIDTDENVPDIDLNKIKAEGVNQKPVVEANAPVDIFESNLGRQPIPQGPIGKIGHNMDINLDDLDEPTTIVPTTSAVPVRPSTVAFSTTRTQPQQQTVSVQTNSAVHGLRNDRFDSSDPRIICGMPADAGICTNYVARWFFNSYTGQCEQFSFGSCGGNLNNFQDRTSCELRCMTAHPALHSQVPERCSYDKDSGFGKGYNVKWYFNMKNLRCEQFVYQGQGGNTNQFETLSDCERFCSPQPAQLRPTAPVAPLAPVVVTTAATTTIAAPAPIEYKSQTLRPLPDVTTVEDTEEYDSQENVDGENVREEEIPDISNPTPTQSIAGPLPPTSQGLPILPPGSEPRPPAAHDVKTITEEEVLAKKDLPVAQTTTTSAPTTSTAAPTEAPTAPTVAETPKAVYTARPLSDGDFTPREQLPIVGASPKEEVNYQTGRKAKAEGITNFADGRVSVDEINSGAEDLKNARPSCPNGRKEFRYADGRPVMCLPGLKHCPDKSVCYFNGVDYFCCPNEEDPYDRHAFGGYGGEETRNGYKVFGPLRVRRLMDETPLRNKRQTTIDRAFNTNPVSFNLDSVVAPLRFDAEKPRHISKAGVMRRPVVPKHGNPMCILPLAKGDCSAAHLRYYYDRNSDSCRLFYYSGCQGNANNFGSLEDCQRLCILGGQIAPAVQADAVTPATIVAPGQCPNGAPLGGNAPVLCGNSTDSIGCPTGFYCRGGPPDICCPGVDPNNKVVQHGVKVVEEPTPVPGIPRSYYKEALLSTPKYMCPDASDPLMGTNGQPLVCGAGFDGVNMCPREYYCAIDGAKGSRLCCPFFGASQRLPAETVIGPYFGRRNPNPGEVIDRGSLPSDQQEYQKKLSEEARSEEVTHHKAVPTTTPKAESGEEEYDGDDEEQHLMLKSVDRNQKAQQEAATSSPKASAIEDEAVNIDVPTDAPVIEEPAPVATPVKYVKDKSVCHLKPTEGRACREDEKPPRTNLHYFYSAKDNRCKLYFYRGCGGNENRFEKKADCEAMCMSA